MCITHFVSILKNIGLELIYSMQGFSSATVSVSSKQPWHDWKKEMVLLKLIHADGDSSDLLGSVKNLVIL